MENLTLDKQQVVALKSFLSNTLYKTKIRLDRNNFFPFTFFCSRVIVLLVQSDQNKVPIA